MARAVIWIILVQSFICKVLSIYAQPTIQQYLHLTGSPHSPQTITIPATQQVPPPTSPATSHPRPPNGVPSLSALALPELITKLQQLQAMQQAVPTPNHVANQPRPTTGLPSLSALAIPNLVSSLQQAPVQKASELKPQAPSSVDTNVLNNLAIALQLLLVSNILNSSPAKDLSTKSVKEVAPCSEASSSYSQNQAVMPNSNFVGSSGFAEPNLVQVYKPTRNSMSLLSPYEALETVSPYYSDSNLSQYGSINSRQDFQSPYAMMTDKDVFCMNDLF